VPEDCKHTWKQQNLFAINNGELVAEVTNQSLGHGAANGRHAISSQIKKRCWCSVSGFGKDYCVFPIFAR
jgi:hypothetical protein